MSFDVLKATKTIDSAIIAPYTVPVPTVTITFDSPISIASGNTYTIVASAPDAAGASFDKGISWRYWSEFSGTTEGAAYQSATSGAEWDDITFPGEEGGFHYFHYIAMASAVEKDKPPLTGGSASYYFGKVLWLAQSFVAASSYSLTSLILEMHKYAYVDAGDLTISLYEQAAGYTFTPPAGTPTPRRLVAAAMNRIWYEEI